MADRHRPGRLSERTALITGASRGIGRAIALRYAEEGADLFLVATNRAKLEETKALAEARGAKVVVHAVDVSDRAAVEAMLAAAIEAFRGVDVLVNNAGVYKAARLVDYTPEDFDRIMKVNLYGAFHVMQLVLRHMQARGRGKVINIASTAGKWMSMNQSAYNASKHALVGLTRCAGLEMGPQGINVNAICPGFVETDMLEEFRAHADIRRALGAGEGGGPCARAVAPLSQARGNRAPRGLSRLERVRRHDRAVDPARWRHGRSLMRICAGSGRRIVVLY
jgi:meso-butanediol dehydrogenase/(S,S)-butanediol dehydrogenase/diacetyl reductase